MMEMNTMNDYTRDNLVKELTAGICELTYVDKFSVEHKISATLSPNHLNGESELNDSSATIRLWNMRDEEWQNIVVSSIIDLERLTGFGVKDERDLVDLEEFQLGDIGTEKHPLD